MLSYYVPVTVPAQPEPDPVRFPRLASTTAMEAVARCYGAMAPEQLHDWLEAGS